ncbi:hypothetical protein V6Z12_D09G037100 [Gossypium hirsutum]
MTKFYVFICVFESNRSVECKYLRALICQSAFQVQNLDHSFKDRLVQQHMSIIQYETVAAKQ